MWLKRILSFLGDAQSGPSYELRDSSTFLRKIEVK